MRTDCRNAPCSSIYFLLWCFPSHTDIIYLESCLDWGMQFLLSSVRTAIMYQRLCTALWFWHCQYGTGRVPLEAWAHFLPGMCQNSLLALELGCFWICQRGQISKHLHCRWHVNTTAELILEEQDKIWYWTNWTNVLGCSKMTDSCYLEKIAVLSLT